MEAAFAGTTPEVKAALGMSTTRIGGGVVTVMADDPTGGFWSRAVGFGITEPVTESIVDEVLAFARVADAKSLLWHIAPRADGPWEEILAARGVEAGPGVGEVRAPIEDVHAATATDLRIATIELARCPSLRRSHDRGVRDAGRQRPPRLVRLAGRHPRLPDVRRVGRRHPRGDRVPVYRERHRVALRRRDASGVPRPRRPDGAHGEEGGGCRDPGLHRGSPPRPAPRQRKSPTRRCTTCATSAWWSCTSGATGSGARHPTDPEAAQRRVSIRSSSMAAKRCSGSARSSPLTSARRRSR